jgi:FKBP-type peptidyl-prolyl cis-trans isomerase FkpA
MRNFVWGFLAFVGFVLLNGSCKKNSGCGYSDQNVVAPLSEQKAVKSYLDSIGVSHPGKDSSGFYYTVVEDGSGNTPNLCSQIEVSYTGSLTNGNIFEQKSTAFTLGSSIEGLRRGIQLIKKGGHIKLYIPPTLAYGAVDVKDDSGKIVIPANSILIFDITLTTFY